MAHSREGAEKPLVALESDQLLGMRQLAKVSNVEGLGRGPDKLSDRAAASRAETSRMLSKIGPPEA